MSSEDSIWYRLGFALERARQAPTTGARKLATLKERRPAGEGTRAASHPAEWPTAEQLLASGAVAAVAKALDVWRPRRETGAGDLFRSALAGAAAALAVEVLRPLVQGRVELPKADRETLGRLLAGAGQGLVYGVVVEPRLPGPSLLKGTLYGTAEFAVDPAGGLSRLLGPHAPLKRVPVLGAMLDDLTPGERAWVEHLAFGVAVAVIYATASPPRADGDDA